jgi:hypothetical protein
MIFICSNDLDLSEPEYKWLASGGIGSVPIDFSLNSGVSQQTLASRSSTKLQLSEAKLLKINVLAGSDIAIALWQNAHDGFCSSHIK